MLHSLSHPVSTHSTLCHTSTLPCAEAWFTSEQVRQTKKAEVQSQKKAEKAAREAAERDNDLRSYKHVMQVWNRASHSIL